MKIHEYQAKEILNSYGVPVPQGRVARTTEEALKIAKELSGTIVIKAQIHAGGRGKGGGIKFARNNSEIQQIFEEILGMNLITHQTGPKGQKVKNVLVEEAISVYDQEEEWNNVTFLSSSNMDEGQGEEQPVRLILLEDQTELFIPEGKNRLGFDRFLNLVQYEK